MEQLFQRARRRGRQRGLERRQPAFDGNRNVRRLVQHARFSPPAV
jgi:hypothetical protein